MKTVQERVEDAMREVGTLLIAFAPLDVALSEHRGAVRFLLLFLVVGAVLFGGSVWLERRTSRVG